MNSGSRETAPSLRVDSQAVGWDQLRRGEVKNVGHKALALADK